MVFDSNRYWYIVYTEIDLLLERESLFFFKYFSFVVVILGISPLVISVIIFRTYRLFLVFCFFNEVALSGRLSRAKTDSITFRKKWNADLARFIIVSTLLAGYKFNFLRRHLSMIWDGIWSMTNKADAFAIGKNMSFYLIRISCREAFALGS